MCKIYKQIEKMRIKEIIKSTIGITLFITCVYILFIWIPKQIELNRNSGISVGEIWMYESGTENPFEKEEIRCYKVLDVKDGYVKYLALPKGYVSSSSVSIFKFHSKKIK